MSISGEDIFNDMMQDVLSQQQALHTKAVAKPPKPYTAPSNSTTAKLSPPPPNQGRQTGGGASTSSASPIIRKHKKKWPWIGASITALLLMSIGYQQRMEDSLSNNRSAKESTAINTNNLDGKVIPSSTTVKEGTFGGIGIRYVNNSRIIDKVYNGTPAYKSGLSIGDIITHINGISVAKWGSSAISNAIRGKPNTAVTLTFQRTGYKPITVSISREIINPVENPVSVTLAQKKQRNAAIENINAKYLINTRNIQERSLPRNNPQIRKQFSTTANLNLRLYGSIEAPILETLSKGSCLTLSDKKTTGQFISVTVIFMDKTTHEGYVHQGYLKEYQAQSSLCMAQPSP